MKKAPERDAVKVEPPAPWPDPPPMKLAMAAKAYKNAVEERERLRAEVEEARREWEAADRGLDDANRAVNETFKLLTAAALGKPE